MPKKCTGYTPGFVIVRGTDDYLYIYDNIFNEVKAGPFDNREDAKSALAIIKSKRRYTTSSRYHSKLGFRTKYKGGQKPHQSNPSTRFVAYVGDYVIDVGNSLTTAFDLTKEHSVRSGESYLYDVFIDKMIAHFINGTRVQEGKQTDASRSVRYQRKGPQIGVKNPKRGVLIYAQVNRIIATKKQKHICDAECKRHGHRYFHDFTSSPKMYGLPNGDLLITTR